jgi:AraC-like DNA-binding protein
MSLIVEARASDSPYIEAVMRGWTMAEGSSIRPAEANWHMVFVKHPGGARALVVGPWTTSGTAAWGKGAEILWVKFKLGAFLPHLPTRKYVNGEISLPDASSSRRFWLRSAAHEVPDFENVETFIDRLAHNEELIRDPVVHAALEDQLPEMSARTVRHRFLQSTGLTQSYIRQFERAKHAAALLRQGVPILDTVFQAGYFDQPHLTRALKQFIGYTPAQLLPDHTP